MERKKAPPTRTDAHLIYDAFRAAPIGVALEDLEGRPVFVNAALCEMLGFSEEELRNKHCVEFSPPEDSEKDWALFQQLRAGSIDHYHMDKRYFRRDGSLIWGRLSISLLKNGTHPFVVAMVEDITAKKTTEQALLSRLEFESLLSELSRTFISLPENEVDANIEKGLARVGVFLKMDRITLYEFYRNRRGMAATYGWNAPGMRESPRLVTTDAVPWWRDQILRGNATLVSQLDDLPEEAFLEKEFLRQRGVVSAAAIPLQAAGNINGVIIFVTVQHRVSWTDDLTNQLKIIGDIFWNALKRKRGMEVLLASQLVVHESEERFRLAMNNIASGVYTLDLNGLVTYINRAAEKMVGWTNAELLGKKMHDVTHYKHPDGTPFPSSDCPILQVLKNGIELREREDMVVRRDGSFVPVICSASPLRNAGEIVGIVIGIRDDTQRREAERAIRESEKRFRLVADTAPVMIWMSGTDKLCTYLNQTWLDFIGRSLEEELRNGWAEGIHPEDSEECLKTYTNAFDSRERFRMEYRLRRHDGEYRWILDSGVPRFNADGSFVGYIGSAIDVTEHRLAEDALSTVSQKLIEAHEEERTRIARELHDDINQRLAFLLVRLDGLKQGRSTLAVESRSQIGEIQQQLHDLANDVQTLSHRLHSPKLEYLGLETAAASFCKELSDRQAVEIDFRSTNIPKELSQDTSLSLFRVLQEALQNAIKHSGSRQFQVSLEGGANVIELTVRDSGLGFDPEEAIKGRGLGLTSMRERLKLVNGNLSIESQLQRGTAIRARVPFHRRTKSAGAAG